MTDNQKRIHFIGDIEDLGAVYKCKRCGHATATKVEMKEHRDGIIITNCEIQRLKNYIYG